ncbi:MAG: membrane-associated protein [Gemmatimonadaceae bacterium]
MTAVPVWLKLAYTAYIAVLTPAYARKADAGPLNFLWFSDLALFATGAALWMESALLASATAVAVLAPELFWNLSFLVRLLTGKRLSSLTDYMFDSRRPLFMRGLSLFHVVLPVVLIWLLASLGYDSRALLVATIVAWIVLPLTYALTKPEHNINWVFGFGSPPRRPLPARQWLVVLMVGFPVLVYWPTHLVLREIF